MENIINTLFGSFLSKIYFVESNPAKIELVEIKKIKSEIKEIYALGIGLVYIAKSGNGVNFKQRLKRRISPDEFINLQSDNK
jgi:hypothetical protein